ncbi:MAG: AbrB/MazE/SpoVT family DNA-binding domain-containing protein [Planctomycetota bacterium]|nr:MAG: AbrB/MazE/SpoVT family DNA-binding domain-containing protein [Planctomycetota bacterium]
MGNAKLTKVFTSGSSQAVRIPKEYRLPPGTVVIRQVPGGVFIGQGDDAFAAMAEAVEGFDADFLADRQQGTPETRELW